MRLEEAKKILGNNGYILSEVYTTAAVKEELRKALIAFDKKISAYSYSVRLTDRRYSHTRHEWDANPYDHYSPVRVYKTVAYDVHDKAQFLEWLHGWTTSPMFAIVKTDDSKIGNSHFIKLDFSTRCSSGNEYVDDEGIDLWWRTDYGKPMYGDVDDFAAWLNDMFVKWKEADLKMELQSRKREKEEVEMKKKESRTRENRRKLNASIIKLLDVPLSELTDKKLNAIVDVIYDNDKTLSMFNGIYDRERADVFEEKVNNDRHLMTDEDGRLPTDIDTDQDYGYKLSDILTLDYDYAEDMLGYGELPDLSGCRDDKSKMKKMIEFVIKHVKGDTLYDVLKNMWMDILENDDNFDDLVYSEVRRINDYWND